MFASTERLQVLSQVPGRIRLHLPGWTGESFERIVGHLSRIDDVRSVKANSLTGNVLLLFDHQTADADSLLSQIDEMLTERSSEESALGGMSNAHQNANPGHSLLRVGVRGLLGHAVVDSLWFGAGFLGSALGLPLAGLGPLHVLMDIAVWTMAFAGEQSVCHPRTSSISRDPQRSADPLPFGSQLTS